MNASDTTSRAVPDVARLHHPPLHAPLSEVASEGIRARRLWDRGKDSWRDTHTIDATMRAAYEETATAISDANYPLNRNSHRINALLTLNADQLARDGETPQAFLRRSTGSLRNLYRGRTHAFAGVWRFEIGTDRYGGRHYHLAFHSPRGMRDKILDALQRWHDESMDVRRSSKSFRHAKWHVVGVRRGWELRRIHALDGALDYLAKVPLDTDGTPVPRDTRLAGAGCRVREFGTFGQR